MTVTNPIFQPITAFTQFSVPVSTSPATTAPTANLLYYHALLIPYACTLTGARHGLVITQAGNVIAALYNSAGVQVAVSASTAVPASTTYHHIPYTGTYNATAGYYYIACIYSSASASIYQAAVMAASTTAAQGGFSAPGSITLPSATSVVATPMMGTY